MAAIIRPCRMSARADAFLHPWYATRLHKSHKQPQRGGLLRMELQRILRSGHIRAKFTAWITAACICSALLEAGCGGNSRQLLSLSIAPATASTTVNDSVLFTLVGTYSSNPLTVDEKASWTSANSGIASINPT